MADLLTKRHRAREVQVDAGGHTWTLRRPTAFERASSGSATPFDTLCRCICGWDLREIDLVPGGGPEPVPFDSDLLADYLADTPQLWEPLAAALMESINSHDARLEAAAKN